MARWIERLLANAGITRCLNCAKLVYDGGARCKACRWGLPGGGLRAL